MVMERRKAGFFPAESGVALTEALIVFPIMLLAVAVCVEFTYVMFQWNSAAKAMQLGARRLIVSDPVTTDFATVFAFDSTAPGGELISADSTIRSVCGAGAAACAAGRLEWLVNGGGAGTVWPGLRAYYPSIELDDIRVTYEQSGLGFNGRPSGPVVTVRLEMMADRIGLLALGTRLGIPDFIFPPFTVTATSEDLCSASGIGC
jgi:hypothetical protein